LVELVIAMSILAVGLVGAMRVFPVGLRASQRSEVASRAVLAAQRTIESLKLTPWEELTGELPPTQEDGFDITTRLRTPSIDHLLDETRLKAVDVTVQTGSQSRPHRLTVVTYLRREG